MQKEYFVGPAGELPSLLGLDHQIRSPVIKIGLHFACQTAGFGNQEGG